MDPVVLLLTFLACYRATLLVSADEITRPWRERIIERGRFAGRLIDCPWCVSIWVAPPIVGSALAWGDGWGWHLAAGSLAASAVTGIAASYASP